MILGTKVRLEKENMLPSLTWLFMGYSKKFGCGTLKETTKKPSNNSFGGQSASLLLPQKETNQMERKQEEDIRRPRRRKAIVKPKSPLLFR